MGNGDGTFEPAVIYPVSGSPWSLSAADVNGDRKLDIVAVNVFTNISILLGNGNGTFGPATNFNGGSSPRYVVGADFNGDGKADLAVANGDFTIHSRNYLSILINSCPPPSRRHSVRH